MWFYQAVKYAYDKGFMTGVSDSEFAPDITLTRAMLVSALYRIENEPTADGELSFSDVSDDSWYAKAPLLAYNNDIISGKTETEFDPNSDITREQMAVILYRYAKTKGYNSDSDEITYSDVKDIAEYAIDSVKWAYCAGIMTGDENGNFNPQANVSRQEFVKMLISALNIDLDSNAEMSFDDVSDSDWSYKYIRKAVELNIVYGVSDTMFDKTSNITRQDMAVMCTRALSVIGNDISSDAELNFTDKDNIASYAAPSVAAMQAKGIISGYEDGSFLPQNNAARCEAAKIISELIKLEG